MIVVNGNNSMKTVVDISKKITELLDTMELANSEMLITKTHIKHNLNQLIRSSLNSTKNISEKILIEKESNKFSNNLSVDKRGKLKSDFSFGNY